MRAEEEKGRESGRPRSKIVDLQEMVALAKGLGGRQ